MKRAIATVAAALLIGSPAMANTVDSSGYVTIQPNQSLASLVQKHGISLKKLRSLNPGTELSKLTVGSKVRVAMPLLAARPETDPFERLRSLAPTRVITESVLDAQPLLAPLPSNTVDTVQKQRIRQQIEQRRQAEAEERRRRYRTYGPYTFDWTTWGKSGSGVRSVKATAPFGITEIAVDCRNYKISRQLHSKMWLKWELPKRELVDFVAESCANVLGASKPIYIEPEVIPVSREEPKVPACTGPLLLCGMH